PEARHSIANSTPISHLNAKTPEIQRLDKVVKSSDTCDEDGRGWEILERMALRRLSSLILELPTKQTDDFEQSTVESAASPDEAKGYTRLFLRPREWPEEVSSTKRCRFPSTRRAATTIPIAKRPRRGDIPARRIDVPIGKQEPWRGREGKGKRRNSTALANMHLASITRSFGRYRLGCIREMGTGERVFWVSRTWVSIVLAISRILMAVTVPLYGSAISRDILYLLYYYTPPPPPPPVSPPPFLSRLLTAVCQPSTPPYFSRVLARSSGGRRWCSGGGWIRAAAPTDAYESIHVYRRFQEDRSILRGSNAAAGLSVYSKRNRGRTDLSLGRNFRRNLIYKSAKRHHSSGDFK
ncbi:hypothetical protein DBV15_10625, partial [Temnothorax longispinosus]